MEQSYYKVLKYVYIYKSKLLHCFLLLCNYSKRQQGNSMQMSTGKSVNLMQFLTGYYIPCLTPTAHRRRGEAHWVPTVISRSVSRSSLINKNYGITQYMLSNRSYLLHFHLGIYWSCPRFVQFGANLPPFWDNYDIPAFRL